MSFFSLIFDSVTRRLRNILRFASRALSKNKLKKLGVDIMGDTL